MITFEEVSCGTVSPDGLMVGWTGEQVPEPEWTHGITRLGSSGHRSPR